MSKQEENSSLTPRDERAPTGGHTPGPWRWQRGDSFDHGEDGDDNGFEILLGAGQYVHERIRYCEDIWPEDAAYKQGEANARLIAAAPDLLAALQALVERGTDSPEHRAAEAAIARATA